MVSMLNLKVLRIVVLTASILAFSLATLSTSGATACDPNERCDICRSRASGTCVRGNDPACEARKAACQAAGAPRTGPPRPGLPPGRAALRPPLPPPPVGAPSGRPTLTSPSIGAAPAPAAIPVPRHGYRAPSPGLWAVRALIEPAEMPPRDGVGYGIVAFTTRALSHDMERYQAICEAYKATLISANELPPNTPPAEQMVTYWPISNKNTPEAQRADCPHLVSNYALRLALDAIQDADKQNQRLASRRGPFLIAWAPSESRFMPDAVVLVLDLSDKDSQRSFTEVFQDWRQKITDNPEVWRRPNGFNVELVRRIIRDTFDRYGDGVLRLVSRQ
jgi:hypothetical protein